MARALEKDDSVFDFLYIDTQRIAIFLSQFGQDGDLKELTRSTEVANETAGGIDLKLASIDQSASQRTTLQRRFDPQWIAPLRFLDVAQSMIVREPGSARIGQFVLATGALSMTDLSILKTLWDSPVVNALVRQGAENGGAIPTPNRAERRRAGGSAQASSEPNLIDLFLTLIKEMPHAIQAKLAVPGVGVFWSSLKPDGLTIASSDMLLKHGIEVAGTWNIVGVLDSLPEAGENDTEVEAVPGNMFETLMKSMLPVLRLGLARPAEAWGITPLLIFREVGR